MMPTTAKPAFSKSFRIVSGVNVVNSKRSRSSAVSQVVFDENHRIRVLSGPLEGLEGLVVHVDRRKHRAKVRMEFDRGTFTVTLGFSLMAGAPAPGGPL